MVVTKPRSVKFAEVLVTGRGQRRVRRRYLCEARANETPLYFTFGCSHHTMGYACEVGDDEFCDASRPAIHNVWPELAQLAVEMEEPPRIASVDDDCGGPQLSMGSPGETLRLATPGIIESPA